MNIPLHILLVEDNPGDARLAKIALGEMGHEITVVARLSDGIAAAQAPGQDLVLLDLTLPDSRGWHTLSEFREQCPKIPIVVLTGDNDDEAGVQAARYGADDFLSKRDLTSLHLGRAIRYACERKGFQNALRLLQERFEKTFKAAPDSMTLSTLTDGVFLEVNAAFERMSGYSRAEAIGSDSQSLGFWVVPSQRDELIRRVRAGQTDPVDMQFRNRAGEQRIGEVGAQVIDFGGRPCLLAVVRDVTEARRAEQGLHESEERYRALAETASDVLISLDERGTIAFINSAARRLLGFEPEELIGKNVSFLDADHEAKSCSISTLLTAFCFDKERNKADVLVRRKDGSTAEMEISFGQFEKDGEKNLIGIARDIGDRRAMEKRLQLSDDLLNRVATLVLVADEHGNIAYANNAVKTILGFEPEQVLGDGWWKRAYMDSDMAEAIRHRVAEAARGVMEPPAEPYENTIVDKSGAVHFILWRDVRGLNQSLIGVGHDITSFREVQGRLQETELRFRSLFEQSPNPIFVVSDNDSILEVNETAVATYGYSREEFLRMPFSQLADTEGQLMAGVSFHRTKAGHPIQVELSTRALSYLGMKANLVQARDVTERMSLQNQLYQAQKMEAIGQLAGGIAHDFNNLLSVILGHCDLMETMNVDAPIKRRVEQIRLAGDRATNLTRKLLAFSRKQVMSARPIAINEVLRSIEDMTNRLIGENIALEFHLDPQAGVVVADQGQVEQVLMNLVINARDAIQGRGTIKVATANRRIENALFVDNWVIPPGEYVVTSVTDTGSGIDPQHLSRIFEPFFTTKRSGEGTGLGLATVYGIVKQSSGYITVSSQLGAGTRFDVYLPQVKQRPEQSTQRHLPILPSHGQQERVLIAEDEDNVRELIAEILDGHGYKVFSARNGEEALRMFESLDFNVDLLLTDVIMPGLSGSELRDRALELKPELRVLFLSGYPDETLGERGILEPGTNFLGKPFTAPQLLDKISEVLNA